uniref:Uncharacterized protein n=1 Tax=Pavo cristatus TaxID=9049 RepID=A0A8C9ELV9_PAVCR
MAQVLLSRVPPPLHTPGRRYVLPLVPSGCTSPPAAPLGVAEKPGACPAAAPEGLFYPCSFRCQEDKDCLGSQKCCPLGCGPACVEPAQDICHLPAVPGPCGGHELSFFYNVTSGRCETFPYSGCGGNANRFGTRAACRRACLGKDGFCPASAGLFPSYDCREWCRHDADCPSKEKCCLRGCDYVCLRPAQGWTGSRCQDPCAGDEQCPRDEKCCSSQCGHVCMAPEPGEGAVMGMWGCASSASRSWAQRPASSSLWGGTATAWCTEGT